MSLSFSHAPFASVSVPKDWIERLGRVGAGMPVPTLLSLSSTSSPGERPDTGRTMSRDPGRPAARFVEAPNDRRGRRHAVVLDQDPNVLEILGQLLRDEGFEVTLTTELPDQKELSRLAPDVIIADAEFNRGEDGQCLYSEPLLRPDGTAIPVVYSTIKPEVAARLSHQRIPILLKPFDLETLLALVGRDVT